MHVPLIALVLLFSFVIQARAGVLPEGKGLLFGSDHAFYLTAPKGWVLDNTSGVQAGVHMAFYPEGETWADSPVVAYGRSVTRGPRLMSVEDLVAATVGEFRANGSADYRAIKQRPVKLASGTEVPIYFFEGDQWGNYEAAAYFLEKQTINFLVFNARSKEAFRRNLPAFRAILSSYRDLFTASVSLSEERFAAYVDDAKSITNMPAGAAYEQASAAILGQIMAGRVGQCLSYSGEEEPKPFQIIMKIERDGTVSEAYSKPVAGLGFCLLAAFIDHRFPPHTMDVYLQHVRMNFSFGEQQ
jgi:hypothetical protein